MRSVTRVVAFGLLLALILPGSESAAGTQKITELDFVFTPNPVSVVLGDTITWQNHVQLQHNTTDLSAFHLWDSGLMRSGETFSYIVTAASTYPYYCQLHERYGMFGTFGVQDQAFPPSGPVGTVFTITVATDVAPAGSVYDIQKRDPGGTFQNWMVVTDPSVSFDSTGMVPGPYRFRSRLRRSSDGAVTEYSPAATVRVTT